MCEVVNLLLKGFYLGSQGADFLVCRSDLALKRVDLFVCGNDLALEVGHLCVQRVYRGVGEYEFVLKVADLKVIVVD